MMDERNYNSYKQLTDMALGMMLDAIGQEADEHEKALKQCREDQSAIRAEMNRRKFDEQRKNFPDLPEAGAKLQATTDFVRTKPLLTDYIWELKTASDNNMFFIMSGPIGTSVTFEMLMDMRRAYLRDNPPTI